MKIIRTEKSAYVGTVFRDPMHGLVFVLSQEDQYIREDGLSFGLDDDQGWLITLTCRPATEEEARPLLGEEAKESAYRAKEVLKEQLFQSGGGEYVDTQGEQIQLRGIRLRWKNGFTSHGGGEEFLYTDDGEIWRLVNNGGDGDDWSLNNVRTGGAGAIGRRYTVTPERLNFLRTLPGGEHVGMTEAERRQDVIRRYRARIRLRPELAGLFDEDPVDAIEPGPTVWEYAEEKTHETALVGMDPAGTTIYFLGRYSGGFEPEAPRPYDYQIWSHGSRVCLRYETTPARVAAIRALWPSWVGTQAPGRYVIKDNCVCENAAEMLRAASQKYIAVSTVDIVPGATVLFASPGTERGKSGVVLWSDNVVVRITGYSGFGLEFYARARHEPLADHVQAAYLPMLDRAGFPSLPAPPAPTMELSEPAVRLLVIALAQKKWRGDGCFKNLYSVVKEERAQKDHWEHRRARSGEEATLYQVAVEHADGRRETLWLVKQVEWSMGEDGDVDETWTLHVSEKEARAVFSA